jgi:hypothetical protein
LLIPFEGKYRMEREGAWQLKGLNELWRRKEAERGHAVTKALGDFGVLEGREGVTTKLMRAPAPLLCPWMGG